MDSPRVLLVDDHPRLANLIGRCVAEAAELVDAIRTVVDGRGCVSRVLGM